MARLRSALAAMAAALLLHGCASTPPADELDADASPPAAPATPRGPLLAGDDRIAFVRARRNDDAEAIAARHLGDGAKGWWIAEFNGADRFAAGEIVAVPRSAPNPLGVGALGYQTIPILCYHRFGSPKRRLSVTRADFEAQMDYLAQNGYRVVPLSRLVAFLEGREALPPKSVVITIDDGYRSTYEIAFPVLRKHGFPATAFLYSDFVGAGDALTWAQMQEMARSGLIEIEPHSRTHSNLTVRLPGESQAQYRDRVRGEVERPSALIADRVGVRPTTYAFPYGDVNETVVGELERAGLRMGVTVTPGGNAFFAYPYMLRRTMVFGTDDLETFKSRLQVFTPRAQRNAAR